MSRLQFWCALLLGWFFVFYNAERLYEPINIASFIYALAAVAALAIIACPALHRCKLQLVFMVLAPIYVILKLVFRYHLDQVHLPIVVTEITALVITVLLARRLGQVFEEVRRTVANSMLKKHKHRSQSFKHGQREIHREMRRARTYRRPLALLAIQPTSATFAAALNRFLEDVQRETIRDYAKAQLAGVLSDETKACDIIMHRNEHFVTLLPETTREQALALATRLAAAAKEKLDFELKLGLSIFPDEEVTFVRLLERAEHQMAEGGLIPDGEIPLPDGAPHTNGELTHAKH